MTITNVTAVVATMDHCEPESQCSRQVGSWALTAPSSTTPWVAREKATARIVATTIAPRAQGMRPFIFSPTINTARVPSASAIDHPLTCART